MKTQKLDLEAIEARANAATEGPWVVTASRSGRSLSVGPDGFSGRERGERFREDAEFTAAARTDVPALVAFVRQLQAEVKDLREELRHVTRDAQQDLYEAARQARGEARDRGDW